MAGLSTQGSLRKALGAIKDSTKVGLAKVNSTYKDLDIAVVKATNHVECPPKEKHVRSIFFATSASRPRADVAYCINALARRIAKTHNWTVALKAMVVIHRTLREGDPTFREELINYSCNRGHILNLSNFKDDSSPNAWDYSAWVRTYALYLEERLECFRVLRYDVESERAAGHSRTRELDTVELLEHLPALQQLLHRLMGCQPEGAAISNYVIQAALSLVVKESFKLCRAINDGIDNLVDKFFEMHRVDASKALGIYKRAGVQADRLSEFYEACKGLDLARNFQFPTLEQPPQSFLSTMEEYVKDAPRAAPSGTLYLKDVPENEERSLPRIQLTPSSDVKEEVYESASPKAEPLPETAPPPAPPVERVGDLLGLDEDLPNAAALEESNALALAIVPEGCIYTLCSNMMSLYNHCKEIASNLMQQCGGVKFNRQLCKLLADIYMNSMADLEKYTDLDAGVPSCERLLAELCRLMCYGERLAKDWANKDWWKSMANSSDSVSVRKKVEIHLKEFLSCVKVLKIAIAEAGCKFKSDLSTVLDSELPMSSVQQASDRDRETLLQHINSCLKSGNSNNDYNLAKHLERRSIHGQFLVKFDDVDVHGKERLGEGSFGTVFKCEFLGRTAAAKVFRCPQNTSRNDVENEVNLLAKLQHPNVVQFIGHTFNETQEVIVLELMREDLESYLASRMAGNEGRPPLPLLGAVDVMLQLAQGMNYLHENHVMHRDLKARNVLINVVKDDENLELSWSRHVKIADFGLSKLKENSQFTMMGMGTSPWRAPEVFDQEDNKDRKYTKAADVYSFAMVFFEVLTGKTPFSDVPQKDLYKKVCRGKRPALPSKAYCPVYLSAFIRRCWATKPEERPPFPEICQMLLYCKELILRDSFPSPLNFIVENDAQKLSSFLGQNLCIEEGLKENMPIHAYSFTVFHACYNGDHVPDHINGMELDWIQEQVKAGKHFGNWISQWQDFDKAFILFSNAAQQKNLEAQYRLGLCFEHGLGTEQNHEKAVELYQLAIQQGYSCAYVELGCCYALGRGVAQSDHEARIMLQRAFEQQTSAGILLPCITELLQYMDSSKCPDATRPSAILEMYQKGYRRALHRVLLIAKFPIGRKLLAGPSLNDNQEGHY